MEQTEPETNVKQRTKERAEPFAHAGYPKGTSVRQTSVLAFGRRTYSPEMKHVLNSSRLYDSYFRSGTVIGKGIVQGLVLK